MTIRTSLSWIMYLLSGFESVRNKLLYRRSWRFTGIYISTSIRALMSITNVSYSTSRVINLSLAGSVINILMDIGII